MRLRSGWLAALLLTSSVVACTDEVAPASGTVITSPPKASASGSQSPAASGSAPTAAAQPKPKDSSPGAPVASQETTAGLLKYMPKDCDSARAFVNVRKIVTADNQGDLEAFATKAMAESNDTKAAEAALAVLREGNVDLFKNLQLIAGCSCKDDKKSVTGLTVDMSKADKPADVIAKALEKVSGKPAPREDVDGVALLQDDQGKWIAVVGKDTILVSKSKDTLKTLLKAGGGGEAQFEDATSHVVWGKFIDRKMDVRIKEAGDDLDANVKLDAGKDAAALKTQADNLQTNIDKAAAEQPILKPLVPAVKNAKVEVAGSVVTLTSKFPRASVGEFIAGLKDKSVEDIRKQLPFLR